MKESLDIIFTPYKYEEVMYAKFKDFFYTVTY